MACDCADKIDGLLAGRNTRLSRAIVFRSGSTANPHLFMDTEQIETGRGKKQACHMFIQFCPFCGVRYDPAPAALSLAGVK